jgi:hypothetical protein
MSQPQPSFFVDPHEQRERITQEIARRFACYGEGTETGGNPIARTLAKQPPMFAFGVKVRDVVDAVLDLAEEERA